MAEPVEGVTFTWTPVPGAKAYRIYRVSPKAPRTLLDRATSLAWKLSKAPTLEARTKRAILGLILLGLYPSPTAINAVLHGHRSHNLNGRECVWRKEVFLAVGLTLQRTPAWPYKSAIDKRLLPKRRSA